MKGGRAVVSRNAPDRVRNLIEARFQINSEADDLSDFSGNELGGVEMALFNGFEIVHVPYPGNSESEMYITSLYEAPFYIKLPTDHFIDAYVNGEKYLLEDFAIPAGMTVSFHRI